MREGNEGKEQRFEFWLLLFINREEMSEGLQERLEENKFQIQRDLTQLESKRGRSQCPEGRDDGSWKSKSTALFANEEILQRFALRQPQFLCT